MAKVAADISQVNQRVLTFMEDQGIPKRQIRATLAKVCGISGSAVYQWFTTTKSINPEHLLSIAREYGTTVDWLLTGENQVAHEPRPATQAGVKNPVASSMIKATKDEILELAKSLEDKDMQTAYKLLKIAMELDKAREIL